MSEVKHRKMMDYLPVFLMGGLFVVVQGLALLIIRPFESAGVGVFQNPDDPLNLVYFFGALLLFTLVILLIAKFWKKQLVRGLVLMSTALMAFYVAYPLLAIVAPDVLSLGLSLAIAVFVTILLVKYPEWYVIDACGILVASGAVALMGISLNVLLVIILLAALAVYDAISVYKTKHMIDLADTVLDLKLPVLFVIPKLRDYSLRKETTSLKEKLQKGEEREAFFMGLGDVIMPEILVASTFYNLGGHGLAIALSVLIGTLLGFVALMKSVSTGKPQAGLPYLCTGAILGYLISSYLLFGTLVGLHL